MKKHNNDSFLEAATTIGIQICRDAIWSGDQCNWMTVTHEPIESELDGIYFRTLFNEFYLGTAGIAYFLASLYRVNPDPLFRKTAIGACKQSFLYKDQTEKENLMGFYRGWPGIAYTLIYVGIHLKEKQLIEDGLKMVRELYDADLDVLKLDIVEGCASAIPIFIKIYHHYPDKELHNFIDKLGNHLLGKVEKSERGWSWFTTKYANLNLTGLAHGAAGFIYSLLELYHFGGDESYKEAAYQSLRYENSYFKESEQNWPDFRGSGEGEKNVDPNSYRCATAWCHGAPGIGLSRLRSYEITKDDKMKEDAKTAIETTMKGTDVMEGYNVSLCHGVFGNADTLINGSLVLNEPIYMEEAIDLGKKAIDVYMDRGKPWLNGVGNSFQIADLMLGLSGFGYFYLRLIDPVKFPSILLVNAEEKFA